VVVDPFLVDWLRIRGEQLAKAIHVLQIRELQTRVIRG
jgi:hypothetical protein